MLNLEKRIAELRAELQTKYTSGDKSGALEISRRLDRLIAMEQRERAELSTKR